MTRAFVDTVVCIHLLAGRTAFNKAAEFLFSMADTRQIKIFVSSLSFSNIHQVLQSQYSTLNSRKIIAKCRTLVNVLPVTSKMIDLSMA
jgi:predicted nucleic acid-binding protein